MSLGMYYDSFNYTNYTNYTWATRTLLWFWPILIYTIRLIVNPRPLCIGCSYPLTARIKNPSHPHFIPFALVIGNIKYYLNSNSKEHKMKEVVISIMMLLTLYGIYFTVSLIYKGLKKGGKKIIEKVTTK